MRHNKSYRKLGRTSEHRRALFRNQLRSLITHERIITTLPKAKELRPIAEKMVTLGRRADSLHARRLAARYITDRGLVKRLFDEIGPRFVSRPGGYTRIVKLGPRHGDGAELAVLEFVDYKLPDSKESKESKKEKKAKRLPEASTGPKT
jgi:large subunit ribosomal protein L17